LHLPQEQFRVGRRSREWLPPSLGGLIAPTSVIDLADRTVRAAVTDLVDPVLVTDRDDLIAPISVIDLADPIGRAAVIALAAVTDPDNRTGRASATVLDGPVAATDQTLAITSTSTDRLSITASTTDTTTSTHDRFAITGTATARDIIAVRTGIHGPITVGTTDLATGGARQRPAP
jgi:hypothetical protein